MSTMASDKKIGRCLICGNDGILTFEHIPPNCSFNNKPIYMQSSQHIWEPNSVLFGKKMISNRGLGGHTLCEQCNNNTGAWYAKDFCEFAKQGMTILSNSDDESRIVKGNYRIKPLNVFKQIVSMFMSADKGGYLGGREDIRSFILDRQIQSFPPEIKIFLYSNASPVKRLVGYSVVYDPAMGINKWSEINFQPFGYFLTEDSQPPNQFMIDITSWKESKYDEQCMMTITTCYLKVSELMIGVYG